MCGSGFQIESTQHFFFLSSRFYHVEIWELLNSIRDIDPAVKGLNENVVINLVLFGSDKYLKETNRNILLNCIT